MDNLPQALERIGKLADGLNTSKHCGCWVTQSGAYWEGRRLCECECECECHGHSDDYIHLLDAVPALAGALVELLPLVEYAARLLGSEEFRLDATRAAIGNLAKVLEANRG